MISRKDIFLWIRCFVCGEKCAVCGELTTGGRGLTCGECEKELAAAMFETCRSCGRPVYGCFCSTPRLREAGCEYLAKLYVYHPEKHDAAVNVLINSIKRRGDAALCDYLARLAEPLATRLIVSRSLRAEDCVILYAPRAKKRIRKTGTDQAKALASAISRRTGMPLGKCILRISDGKEQKSLGADARKINAKGMFAISNACDLRGKTVFLVDDLVTTGATLAECASLASERGAENVFALAVAKTR